MRKLIGLLALSASCLMAQAGRTSLMVTRIYNITVSWAGECGPGVIDNRSVVSRQNNYHSVAATGSGTWSVAISYSDASCSGPWTSFGSASAINQSSVPPIAVAIDSIYTPHPYIQIAITGAATAVYSGSRDYFTASTAGGGGGISFPIAVAQGGTNASNAAGARANLGAAANGANSDITSLAGLITPLPVGEGGTGQSTLAANALLYGSGSSGIGSLSRGTTTTVLHGSASGLPAFAAVDLANDVTGQLPFGSLSGAISFPSQFASGQVQGTDSKVMSSGTISGTAAILCTDANGGATTSGCPTFESPLTFSSPLSRSGNVISLATSLSLSGLTLSGVTGSTQCLHVNSSGVVSGSGADCGVGSGGADANGYYVVTRATNAPTNAVNLGSLTTGLPKITVSGGVATLSTAAVGTDYAGPSNGTNGQGLTSNGSGGFGTAVTFAASATTDATNASNIGSGTLGAARLPSGLDKLVAAGPTAARTYTLPDSNATLIYNGYASATLAGLSLSSVTGLTQCLHVNSAGLISGTGADCGSSGSTGANPNGFYLVTQSTNAPTNGVNMGLLTSGIVKIAVSAGVATPSTAASGTDYELPLTFSAPLSRATNAISLPQANGSTNGYLSSADWTTFNNKLGSAFYQTIKRNGSAQTQRGVTNYSLNFTTSDDSFNNATNVDLSSSLALVNVTASGVMTLSAISGSVQCVHVNSSGVISGTGTDCAGATLLSSVGSALGANTLSNGDNAQAWNWSITTPSKTGFAFGESSASTGSGSILLSASTLSGSTAKPFQATAGGTANGISMSTAGALSPIGSGAINANQYFGNATIAIANGGTGGTTAAGARSSLGAAASGANSDITSLTGMTTPLSIPQGGTGTTTAAGARANLGAAASGVNSDITALNGLSAAANAVYIGPTSGGSAAPTFRALAVGDTPAYSGGDVTKSAGSGTLTLATVNSSPGGCGDATHVCQVTTNGKGLVTSQTAVVISASGSSPTLSSASFNWSQTFSGTINGPVTQTLTPCPLGVNGSDAGHYYYVTGGGAGAEVVLGTGGTCTSGASSGTITFTSPSFYFSTYTIASASQGIQEAVIYAGAGSNQGIILPPGDLTINGQITLNYAGSSISGTGGGGGFGSTNTRLVAGFNSMVIFSQPITGLGNNVHLTHMNFYANSHTGVKAISIVGQVTGTYDDLSFDGMDGFYCDRCSMMDIRRISSWNNSSSYFGTTIDGSTGYADHINIDGWEYRGTPGSSTMPVIWLERNTLSTIAHLKTYGMGGNGIGIKLSNGCEGIDLHDNFVLQPYRGLYINRNTIGSTTAIPFWTTVTNLQVDQASSAGIYVDQGVQFLNITGAVITGFTSNSDGISVNPNSVALFISNSNIAPALGNPIWITGPSNRLTIRGNYIAATGGLPYKGLTLDPSGTHAQIIITGNQFEGTTSPSIYPAGTIQGWVQMNICADDFYSVCNSGLH